MKRRKTLEKNPRLTILSVVKETGEVECRLEISNKNTITFKFSVDNDKPQEIAESLVRVENGKWSNVDDFFSADYYFSNFHMRMNVVIFIILYVLFYILQISDQNVREYVCSAIWKSNVFRLE